MAIVSKLKWEGGYYEVSHQAIVLLDDNIWRVCRGRVVYYGFDKNVFYFVHDGMMYCVNNNSFREININTPEDEIYALVCEYNMDSLARHIEIKNIMKKYANKIRENTRVVRTVETE